MHNDPPGAAYAGDPQHVSKWSVIPPLGLATKPKSISLIFCKKKNNNLDQEEIHALNIVHNILFCLCVYKRRHVFYWSSFSHDLGIAELPHALWLFKILLFTVWVKLEVFHLRTLRKFYFMELLCITWSSSRSRFSWMTNNNIKTCKLLDKFFTCHFSQNT